MTIEKITRIGTHEGKFHADDVFAVAVLRLLFPDAVVVRSRDMGVLRTCDVRVDVGRVFNPLTGDFDHHQTGGAGERQNGIKFSAFGLVWREFGERLTGSMEITTQIDRTLVQGIDACDNGQEIVKPSTRFPGVRQRDVSGVIDGFNANWDQTIDEHAAFMQAVGVAQVIVQHAVARFQSAFRAEPLVREAVLSAKDARLIVLEKDYPWGKIISREAPRALFVVYPGKEGNWRVRGIHSGTGAFQYRRLLPRSWSGLDGDQLITRTGVPDVVFVHNALFTCAAKSREGALKLAQLALEADTKV